ncbi:glycosyltransferase [Tranquillimonas rosea]|uniref:glycosyltransferase n=1 Tax=Tranquillimonas rosea TaxID=641238 RepID=UPI003BA89699
MNKTIYLTRNGALEPLGQSQVLPYLRGLSARYSITLITHEKPTDWEDKVAVERVKAECKEYGIHWIPLRFYSKPKILAPALSLFLMVWVILRRICKNKIGLIHARSYTPASAALIVRFLTGVPFIFDMRGFWPEELITAGRLRRRSLLHRLIVVLETQCLSRAAIVVVLTEAAARYLTETKQATINSERVRVIPTCTDLSRFEVPDRNHEAPIHGCIGTILSGWFQTEWLSTWFLTIAKRSRDSKFEILTRDDARAVRNAVDLGPAYDARLSVRAKKPDEMPEALQGHASSVMFYAGGSLSELGRSPTRMAEVLATGIPVIVNEGVGDVAQIVRKHNVGVVVEDNTEEAMNRAYEEFELLLTDPILKNRCRDTARLLFSLDAGTCEYVRIYDSVNSENE